MKAKHIITTCGVILGGLAVAGNASAIVTYRGSSDVQFTFNPVLSLTLSGDGFVISDLTPGTSGLSNAVVASVTSNSSAGYILKASVGNSTYANTDLSLASSTSRFAMMSSTASALPQGTWGYTIDNGATYSPLALYTATDITTIESSAADSGSVSMKIGAYANNDQAPGTYNNVVNFSVVSGMAAHTIGVAAGTNVSAVSIGASATQGSYNEGDEVPVTATCVSGKTFVNWAKSADFGAFGDASSASTTYTVGNGDVTWTAYCSE